MGKRKRKTPTMKQKLLGMGTLYDKKHFDLGSHFLVVTRIGDKYDFEDYALGAGMIKRGEYISIGRLLEYIETGY